MTAAQELFAHLKDAKPGPNYVAKETPAPNLGISHSDIRAGRLFVPLTPGRVELPALGGCVELIYEGDL